MVSTRESVKVLERLDLLGLLRGDGRITELVIFGCKHGDGDGVNLVNGVKGALSIARIGPVVNVLLEALSLACLHNMVFQFETIGFLKVLRFSPGAEIRGEILTNFSLVSWPCGRGTRCKNSNLGQLTIDVTSIVKVVTC